MRHHHAAHVAQNSRALGGAACCGRGDRRVEGLPQLLAVFLRDLEINHGQLREISRPLDQLNVTTRQHLGLRIS